jgi:hypothetical protein
MKAIICYGGDGSIHLNSFSTEWTPCSCGNVAAKWLNPMFGTVVVAARDREKVRLLGLHNGYLTAAIAPARTNLSWPEYQELHNDATNAPTYIFDKSRIGCWAAVARVGSTNDVRWATDEEMAEAFKDRPE